MPSLNDFFDHIYCINLDRRPDKWKQCQEEFDRVGLKDVERYSAVDGSQVDMGSPLLPGEVGIILSNTYLIMDATLKGYQRILILEDDIQFSPTFTRDWEQWSEEVPSDWQMLYLGGNMVGWHPSPVSEHVHRGEHLYAIHALGLHSSTFDSIISTANLDVPIDVTYSNLSAKFNSYLMVPRMAWQRPGLSDIQNEYVNYTFLHTGQWGLDS